MRRESRLVPLRLIIYQTRLPVYHLGGMSRSDLDRPGHRLLRPSFLVDPMNTAGR
jgi:hypothetical protein